MKILVIACALGSALSAGVFLAFSSFVMAALARIENPSGIAAMQSINITVINPVFMSLLFGSGLVSLGLATWQWRYAPDGGVMLMVAGAAIYVVGVLGITMVFNVPMNDQLPALDPRVVEASDYWRSYLQNWTFWNHVRCLAGIASAALMILSTEMS
jgi:uncharacterized membrane protein